MLQPSGPKNPLSPSPPLPRPHASTLTIALLTSPHPARRTVENLPTVLAACARALHLHRATLMLCATTPDRVPSHLHPKHVQGLLYYGHFIPAALPVRVHHWPTVWLLPEPLPALRPHFGDVIISHPDLHPAATPEDLATRAIDQLLWRIHHASLQSTRPSTIAI